MWLSCKRAALGRWICFLISTERAADLAQAVANLVANEKARMKVEELSIPVVKLVVPRRFEDKRGLFCEVYNSKALSDAGIADTFVQDNMSLSVDVGTIRGLHFQRRPHAQAKLVRVAKGRVLDVRGRPEKWLSDVW